MSKTKETKEIENILYGVCENNRLYGCEEITIGFANNGHGNERVDFATMDSKGTLKCYEIKVTLSDLKSKAKKSWYGHYNYLVVTQELYNKVNNDITEYIPEYVGVAVPNFSPQCGGIEVKKAPKKQELTLETEMMMKESMVRSMSYKILKYRGSTNLARYSEMKNELLRKETENSRNSAEALKNKNIINRIERVLRKYYGIDIELEEMVSEMNKEEYLFPENISLQINECGKERNKRTQEIIRLIE